MKTTEPAGDSLDALVVKLTKIWWRLEAFLARWQIAADHGHAVMRYDFSDELRGEEPMNVKDSGIVPAMIVGVIAAGASVFFSSNSGRSDSTVAALAKLETQVTTLNQQIQELKLQPYVRQEEFKSGMDRLDNRVNAVEGRIERLTLMKEK